MDRPADLFNAIPFSPELKKKLESEEARRFRKAAAGHLEAGFVSLKTKLPTFLTGTIRGANSDLAFTAIDSAFLDLSQAEHFHELNDGPSLEKMGAALACWLNRLKPLDFVQPPKGEIPMLVSPVFALEVGLGILSHGERRVALDQLPPRKMNLLIYTLLWRNPDFRQLATLFELL